MSNTINTKVSGSALVVEGDLLTVGGTAVRLLGIDAPDPGQKCKNRYGSQFDCFVIAVEVLRTLINNADVECVVADKDRNGLSEGECFANGINLGAGMVARGWAFAYRGLTPAYSPIEAWAQSHRAGLWSGLVEKPWQWRSRMLRENAK